MKKLLLLLFVSIPFAGLAQMFNGGVLAGGVVSQVDGDSWEGYHKFGFLAGGYVSLRVSPHSSFQMEMEYIQKGSRKNQDLENNDFNSYLLRLHYLEIPILYQYTFARRLSAEIGPAADILLGSYEEAYDANGQKGTNLVPLRTFTLSGIIGIAGYITNHLKANFRFNYSLLSIRDATSPYPEGYRKILFEWGQYNNVLSVSLCWDLKSNDF
jgi:hypothetical protein